MYFNPIALIETMCLIGVVKSLRRFCQPLFEAPAAMINIDYESHRY